MRYNHLYVFAISFQLMISWSASYLRATIIAKADSTNLYETFTGEVGNKTYDRATGTIYLSTSSSDWYLAKAARSINNQRPQFKSVSGPTGNIEFLALAAELCNVCPYLAFVELSGTETGKQTVVNIVKNDGTGVQPSSTLKDADEEDTCGIVAIAANKSFIFAAVRPGATGGNTCGDAGTIYGDEYGGIAVVSIDPTTLALNQTAAVQGDPAIKAKQLDHMINEVIITATVRFTQPTADLFWDHQLQRLYVALQLQTGVDINDGAKAVVVARVDSSGVLMLEDIAPDGAFNNAVDNIVAIENSSTGTGVYVSIKHVRVMHCSTGPSYLIVNGGQGAPDEVNNMVYALPLVDTNPANQYHGTLADKGSNLTNSKFTQQATMNAQLPTSADAAARVGMGSLPIEPDTELTDIVVVGDTVYVSTNITPDVQNDSGIFYSQALFDETGKIIRWTPWTKRALPYNAFPNTFGSKGRVAFFDIDAVNGKVWAVEGTEKKAVCTTAWDLGSSAISLPTQLNNIFNKRPCNKGSFSVLDLDQSTRGFSHETEMIETTVDRYTLFGGAASVVFALISTAYTTSLSSPQVVIEDFSNPANLLATYLGAGAGCVHVLEYSCTPTTLPGTGYFFAGTETGLFVFADSSGNGFNVEDFAALNQLPFITGRWHHITKLSGSVDIKTIGNRLYVLTFETSCQRGPKSGLYGIDYMSTLDTMFIGTNIDLIAESGVGIFSQAYLFNGIEIVATGDSSNPLSKEQIILSTNNGLFRSCADQMLGDGILSVTNQQDAQWRRLPSGNTKPYHGITAPDSRIPSTAWPISIENSSGNNLFEKGSVKQVSITSTIGCQDSTYDNFVPENFNASSNAIQFQTLDPISHFWSDGARRFFIIQRPRDPYCLNKLLSFPYDVCQWSVCNPGPYVLFDPVILNTKRFYWVHQIGASGILIAGTDSGVIALE